MFLAVAAGLAACSCSSLHQTTKDAAFREALGHFTYAEIDAVKQSGQQTCGAACLACVLRYWDKAVEEPTLVARYPMRGASGYPLAQLREMAAHEGLLAFAIAMDRGQTPAAQLTAQLAKGRPVIIAACLPQGRYFGAPVPIIETWDRRAVTGLLKLPERKHHYLVVCGEDERQYLIMDPAYGIGTVQKSQLLAFWAAEGHAALVCAPVPPQLQHPLPSAAPAPAPAP